MKLVLQGYFDLGITLGVDDEIFSDFEDSALPDGVVIASDYYHNISIEDWIVGNGCILFDEFIAT